jgi:hypothetical protein
VNIKAGVTNELSIQYNTPQTIENINVQQYKRLKISMLSNETFIKTNGICFFKIYIWSRSNFRSINKFILSVNRVGKKQSLRQ